MTEKHRSHLEAIVLAAGRATRMGRQKLLLPFGVSTIIEHIVDTLLQTELSSIIVVTGYDGAVIEEKLAGLDRVQCTRNDVPEKEMLFSVRQGISRLSDQCRAILFMPGDLPLISPAVIKQLFLVHERQSDAIAVPACAGKRGHPLLVPVFYANEIMTSLEGTGLRGLLQNHAGQVVEIDVPDEAVLLDVDYPADYDRVRFLQNLRKT